MNHSSRSFVYYGFVAALCGPYVILLCLARCFRWAEDFGELMVRVEETIARWSMEAEQLRRRNRQVDERKRA